MKFRSIIMFIVSLLVFGVSSVFGFGKSKKYPLKIGTVLTENDPLYKGLLEFKDEVATKTSNNITVEIYPGSQLGNDEDILEQAKLGTGVGVITDPGRLSNYLKDFGILGGPYLARDYTEALKVMETSVYKNMVHKLENYGFKVLSFNYFQGSRNLYTKKPVTCPADLKGQRIRSSGSAVVSATLEAMGANTTVLPWSEAYQALQQKVIDGVEVHNSAAVGSSIYEVTNYVTETGHFQLLTGLVISNAWFQKLPKNYQQILMTASYNAGKSASEQVLKKDKEFLQRCITGGVKLCEVDKAAFITATESVYDKLGYRAMKDEIDKELGRK